jgi:hypothetical protein
LVNRNTPDGEVGFYFITASHCFGNVNSEQWFQFMFNYQSPNHNTLDTDLSNRGELRFNTNSAGTLQSEVLTDRNYQYYHRSRIRTVDHFGWGDFAMYEILTPLPPHFNYTYAGWSPSRFHNLAGFDGLPLYNAIHHPLGDIKKSSGYNDVLWLELPTATGCYTVTDVIDWIFGTSTSTICRYVDIPYLVVNPGSVMYGSGDYGSSGSSLFSSGNQTIGTCFLISNWCLFPNIPIMFGKLHSNYSHTSIKRTFNPSADFWIDRFGMPPRKIKCFDNLHLRSNYIYEPSSNNVRVPDFETENAISGFYFPANHYQPNNLVQLKSANNITTENIQRILPGAEYQFVAANSIVLNPGFEANSGSVFEAKIEPCAKNKTEELSGTSQALALLEKKPLPEKLAFDVDKYKGIKEPISKQNLSIYPNPVTSDVTISYSYNKPIQANLAIYDAMGKKILDVTEGNIEIDGVFQKNISLDFLPSGIYWLVLKSNQVNDVIKFIKE